MKFLDLTASERSDIAYKRMWFPDGQPHVSIEPEAIACLETAEPLEVICRIKSAADIVDVGLALDAVFSAGRSINRIPYMSVNVAYMLGARMDRPIGPGHPFTLLILAELLKRACQYSAGLRVLDPHSEKTIELTGAQPIYPDRLVKLALEHERGGVVIVIPDEGAVSRTGAILRRIDARNRVARCVKKRDPETGNLSGFELVDGDVKGRTCLIVDDLCDGGGTFCGIADVLKAAGAVGVSLCVTHGVFSKGFWLLGIDKTYCTDSFGISDPADWIAERGTQAPECWTTYRRPGREPNLYVLTDFVRDHVREIALAKNQRSES